jgi:uncharacterized protein YqfA (UPF0365 family)
MDFEDAIKLIALVLVIVSIVFSVFVTVRCWNIRLADRVGICAMQHTR